VWIDDEAPEDLEGADVPGDEGGASERRVFWFPKRDDGAMKHPTGLASDLDVRARRGCDEFLGSRHRTWLLRGLTQS
jgi:hypothetical protein